MKNNNAPIAYDPFVLRQFKPEFSGTNLFNVDNAKLLNIINMNYHMIISSKTKTKNKECFIEDSKWDFCKYLIIKNDIPEIKSSVIPIDLSIYPFIRTGYNARIPEELPVLSRWVELPYGFSLPKAQYIVCVLYSREQLESEYNKKEQNEPFYLPKEIQYGIVSIMGTLLPEADPLVPITIMRNSLGMEEGGNGVKLDKELYMKSTDFWNTHILVK